MEAIKNFIFSIIIGGGMILPGVSGTVIMLILGLYDKTLIAFNNFFKDVKGNSLFLLPIFSGLILGVFFFGKILYLLFGYYEVATKWLFIGLILGSCPALFKRLNNKGQQEIKWGALISSFLFSLLIFVFGFRYFNFNLTLYLNNNILSIIILIFAGFLLAFGKVVPGVSSSLLLILIGMYEYYLHTIVNIFHLQKQEYLLLIPFAFGFLGGTYFLIKLIAKMLESYYNFTYSLIIGFILGSLPGLYPGFTFDKNGLFFILLAISGYFLVSIFLAIWGD